MKIYLGICAIERPIIPNTAYVSKVVYFEQMEEVKIEFIQGDICEEQTDAFCFFS